MKDETLQEAFSNWNEISVEPGNLLAYRARLKQVMDEEARVREAQLREEAALEKGGAVALSETAIQLLIEKFGNVPEDIKNGIVNADTATLKLLLVNSFKIEVIDEVRKYI